MKLLRYGEPGNEKPGIIDDQGELRDLSAHIKDIDGTTLHPDSIAQIAKLDLTSLPLVESDTRLGACVANPGKFVAIGLNYSDHAKETGSPIPEEPVVFYKTDTCICGPNDNVIQPKNSTKLDWEVEIAIIMGSTARNITEAEAESCIAGYCVVNDISERAFQIDRGGSQWSKGKGCDTFGPLGPWLVTRDEIRDVQNLDMWLDVNGQRMQTGNTRTMIFNCNYLVSYLSDFMTLMPGDVITTGTPPGVGLGMDPQIWLHPGDVVELGIEQLGQQKQTIVSFPG